MVNGVLYTTTSLGQIAAIDPASGETRWSFDPVLYLDGRPAVHGFMTRGLTYWTDGSAERLFYAGGRTFLLSIDPVTGRPDPDFGRAGRVDLKRGLGRTIDPSLYAVSSPPVVVGDVVVMGSAMTEGTDFREAPPGHVRGFDVRTGEMLWIFHTVPHPGEFGADSWPDGAWEFTGGANVWTLMSADEELGLVYLPLARRCLTTSAAIASATTCSPIPSWPCMPKPASGPGIFNSCTTRYGTTTHRQRLT